MTLLGSQDTVDKQDRDRPDSLLSRFEGPSGATVLQEVLCNQMLVRGDRALADELARVLTLEELRDGDVLIHQGAADNSICLILSGSFSVVVNGRTVATRSSGHHVGEMALIDPTATRSATVVASESSIVARIPEIEFSAIADRNPQIWRRVAVELSSRLKQRNAFLRPPRNQPVVFIGSSSENLQIARAIHSGLAHDDVVINVWTSDVFRPSSTPIESLVQAASESDFAAVILNPDDMIISRDMQQTGPRDNVIFELGLFIGHIGRERTVFVLPRGRETKIPTDLLGVIPLEYAQGSLDTLASRIGPVCNELRDLIRRHGPR